MFAVRDGRREGSCAAPARPTAGPVISGVDITAHDTTSTTRQRALKVGDYVLYRDPALFWTGKPDHTKVCRVTTRWTTSGRIDLVDVVTNTVIVNADPDYTRWLAPEDAMRDIDTAPLDDLDTGAMSPAGAAWLRRLAPRRVLDQS